MLRAIFVCLTILVLPWPAVAIGQSPGERFFDSKDRNKDGKLSREEFPEPLRDAFDRIDTNKDGFISREEDAAARRGMAQGQQEPAPFPDWVKFHQDIPYAGTDNPRQRLDIIYPKKRKTDKPLPVIVAIHGGGWMSGNRAAGGGLHPLADLVASGDYAVVAIGYRLSGEAIWPAQIYDCKAAIRWVRANAKENNHDPDRIGVIGGSAGGHLAAMLGASGGVASLEGDLGPHKGVSSRVQCVVDEFGPAELLAMAGYPSRIDHDSARSPESRLVGGAIQSHKDEARAASPISYVSKDDPPFLIIHGDADPLVPFNQSDRLSKALKDQGVECIFIKVEGGGHGGFRNPELHRRIRQFFDKHLLGRPSTISEAPIANDPSRPKS